MREYWKRASAWAWADARTFVALHKALYRVIVSLSGVVIGWSVFGIGNPRDAMLVAGCALAANILALPAVYVFNLVVRAPVALDVKRAKEGADLRALIPVEQALPSIPRREDDLRRWIANFVKQGGEHRGWLTYVVPEGYNYRDYIEPLRVWAKRAREEILIVDEDRPTGDLRFKVGRKWFDL